MIKPDSSEGDKDSQNSDNENQNLLNTFQSFYEIKTRITVINKRKYQKKSLNQNLHVLVLCNI